VVAAVVLMAIFTLINFLGVRKLANTNSAATWWKMGVPILTIIVLLGAHFPHEQLHRRQRL
jgi:amino acid transporter